MIDKGHEVHWLANGHMGKTIEYARLEDGTEIKAKIHGRLNHPYFADILPQHLKRTKTDILLVILDTFMLHGDPQNPHKGWFLNMDTSPAKTIFWYPSDGGGGLPVGCDLILKRCEAAVAYSKFAQKQIKEYYGLETPYIPLGVEPARFFKMKDEERLLLKKNWGLEGKYVVGCVARNQPRKFLDREIKAFRKVADKIPEAILFLHTDPADPAQPFKLLNLIKRYNLENRVRFSGMSAMNSFPWDKMNEIYNLMDVFFLTTSGEGWGIPFTEAMSAEVPVVATDYTTTREIVTDNNAGLAVNLAGVESLSTLEGNIKDYDMNVSNGTLTGSWEVERAFCDVDDAAKKLIKLYTDPTLRKEMGKNGRKAVLEKYDMKLVCEKFEKLMESLK